MRHAHFLSSLRVSLFAALGLAACGGDVDTSSTGSGNGGSSGSGSTKECDGAVAIKSTKGTDTGFATCPDATVHRTHAGACDAPSLPACQGTEDDATCASDADCTDGPHGVCIHQSGQGPGGVVTSCGCVYPCEADADCKAKEVCVCPEVFSSLAYAVCAPASCEAGSDCQSGECGASAYDDGCGVEVSLGCRSNDDLCRLDAECGANMQCVFGETTDKRWSCAGMSCAIGRPLLVEGAARVAPLAARSDWMATAPANVGEVGLDEAERAALASHYLSVAALEHASVASFARFTMELLSLGAPPELVSDAHRAGLDEVEHARLAFALASSYAGRSFGPGPLDLSRVTVGRDAREVLRALVEEGCVGETLGAAEARAIAGEATDAAVQAFHDRVAIEEQRHAELAYRTLAWMLAGADDEDAAFVERCFAEAIERAGATVEGSSLALPGHGLLGAAAVLRLRRQTLAEVVGPCARAALEARASKPRRSFPEVDRSAMARA